MLKRFNKIRKGLTGFKSELDWSPESWFGKRVAKPDGTKYTEDDVKALQSHLEEYNQIEKDAKANGTWLRMLDGSTWEGDPRAWVMMQSKAYKKNYAAMPWWTGQARWETELETPDGVATDKVMRAPYHNGEMWFSDSKDYGDGFAHAIDRRGFRTRFEGDVIQENGKYVFKHSEPNITGFNFLAAIPKGNYRHLEGPSYKDGKGRDNWQHMPFKLKENLIVRLPKEQLKYYKNLGWSNPEKVLTDDVVHWSRDLGDDGIFLENVQDGPSKYYFKYDDGTTGEYDPNKKIIGALGDRALEPVNEFISLPGFTNKVKFIEGNNGNFDINDPYKYSDNRKHNPNLGRFGLKLKIPR